METELQRVAIDEVASSALVDKVRGVLMPDERVLACAEQAPHVRWWVFPASGVVVTDMRIIYAYRGLFSFRFTDYHWEHVRDVHMDQSMLTSTFRVEASTRKTGMATQAVGDATIRVSFVGLDKEQTTKVYRTAQQMEHTWRERNRARVMEESRAGKVVMMAGAQQGGSAGGEDPTERLRKLKGLLDAGLISPAEYETKKAELVKLL
jgi:hypothetical protein